MCRNWNITIHQYYIFTTFYSSVDTIRSNQAATSLKFNSKKNWNWKTLSAVLYNSNMVSKFVLAVGVLAIIGLTKAFILDFGSLVYCEWESDSNSIIFAATRIV